MNNSIFDKVGGRKFIAYVLTIGGGIAVHLLSAKGVSTELTALMLGALGTFSASNAFISNKFSGSSESESEASPEAPLPEASSFQMPAADDGMLKLQVESVQAQLGELQAVTAQVLTSVNGIGEILRGALTPKK